MKKNIIYLLYVVALICFLTSCTHAIREKDYDEAVAWGCCAVLECCVIAVGSRVFQLSDQYNAVCDNRDDFAAIAKKAVGNADDILEKCGELMEDNQTLIDVITVMQEYIGEDLYPEINEKLQGKRVLFSDKFTPGEMALCYRVKKESDV